MSNTGQYDSVLHAVADKLLEHFDSTGAVNYIEQIFGNRDDPSKSFVLTMQMKDGLTPCEKLAEAEQRIATLESQKLKIFKIVSSFNGGLTPTGYNGKIVLKVDEYNALVNALNSVE